MYIIELRPDKGTLYTNTVPHDATIVGTIKRSGELTAGALVKLQGGQYVQMNAGELRMLDQEKVQAALEAIR